MKTLFFVIFFPTHPQNDVEQILRDDIEQHMSLPFCLPKEFLTNCQSLVELRWPTGSEANEAIALRRLLHCVATSLALNGHQHIYTNTILMSQKKTQKGVNELIEKVLLSNAQRFSKLVSSSTFFFLSIFLIKLLTFFFPGKSRKDQGLVHHSN